MGWIERNPAEYAHPPKVGRRKARPPEPEKVVRVLNQAAAEDLELPADAFVFSPDPVGSRPWHPDHFTHAYRDVAKPLGVEKPLKNLRHFNATQLLAAGVDLSTVAARLGHADGGATTLRVYASWTQPADRAAAEQLAGGLDVMRRRAAADAPATGAHPLTRVARPVEEVFPDAVSAKTYSDVAAALREAIAVGRLHSGDLVPTVTDLAARFAVARSTAQRAVTLLGGEGSCSRAGHRWVVVAVAPDRLAE